VGEQPAITTSPEVTPPAAPIPADTVPEAVQPVENPTAAPSDNPPEAAEVPVGDDAAGPELVEEVANDDDGELPALEPQTADDESDDEADDDEVEEAPPARNERPRRDRRPPARYALATKIYTGSHNSTKRNTRIKMAEIEEIIMCFATLCALEPVFKEDTAGIAALTCHLFTVEKFHADGTYDKTKSRLVAHGDEQDVLMYPDRSLPTVSIHAIMTSLAVAANNRGLKLAKIDVKGAFIQTEMRGPPVYIRCHKKLTELIVEVLPGIRQYVCRDGTLYCRLLKALYGCVQASKLWYDKLSAFLTELGYQKCPVEPCVMKRLVDGKVYQLLIYVDDILIIAEEAEFERLRAAFTKNFQWITMEVNDSLSYLGMRIALGKGYVELDMIFYIDKALQNYKDIVEQPTPGTRELFEIGQSALLDDDARKQFHTTVARLLYLSKRSTGHCYCSHFSVHQG
jgi:hypothetical protein